MRRCWSTWLAICTAAAIATGAESGHAQDAQAGAAAEALFEQAMAAMDKKNYAEACPKFAESQRLDPGIGTLLYLADCFELNGQTASAWARFKEAGDAAEAAGQKARAAEARKRAAALEPRLARLSVSLAPGAEVAGIEIQRDGLPVAKPLWGVALPLDPGSHTLSATAPGKKEFSTTIDVPSTAASLDRTIPMLEDLPVEAAPTLPAGSGLSPELDRPARIPAQPDKERAGQSQRIAGIAVGAAGILGLGVGIAMGVVAKGKNEEAHTPDNCPTDSDCYPEGIALIEDAKSAATISTVGFIAGGVLMAGGVVLFLTAPRGSNQAAPKTGMALAPTIGRERAGFVARATW